MPLKKRVLYDPAAYHRKDVFEESTPDSFLPDHNMSKLLGTMNQLAYLSSFALEIFQNLAVLSEDLSERIKLSSVRTTVLFDSLRAVDREVSSIDDDSHIAAVSGLSAYLQSREMITPQLFNKSTNYNSITAQYRICRPPPQLWRIEVFTHEDCFRNYSNPGFFFQEWIRTEIIRQQLKKEEKKKNKVLRKQQRQERKKLKEEAEAAAAEDDDLLFPLQPFGLIENQSNEGRNSSNVSLSGVTDKGKRSKSILSPNREDFKKKMQAESNDRNATRRASPPRDQLHQQQQQQQQQQRERDYSFDQAEQNQSDAEEGSVRMGTRGPQNSNNNTNNTAVIDTVKEKQKKKGLKGLSKLFKRSKKDKEHKTGGDSDELSESEEEIYQTQQNAHINAERERGLSRDLLMSDSDDATHFPRKLSQSPPISQIHPQTHQHSHTQHAPKSYVEELTAAATTTTRRMSVSRMYPLGAMAEYANEDDDNLYDEAPRMQLQPIPNNRHTAKRRKQAPVTMKIGSKFLSASSGGNSKAEKTVTDTVPDLGAHVDERKKDAQSRQSKARTLLRQPSSTPAPTTHTAPNKKANKRQSFALPAQSTSGMFNDRRHQKSFASATAGGMNGSVKSSDDEDSAGDMLAGSSLRRRSLLTMLQDEVFEELHREQEEAERESDFPEPEEEEEEEEENYDEYGNPIPIAGSRNSGKSVDIFEDDVDPDDDEEGNGGVDITEEDVFAGENDGDGDFIDEQDAPDSDQEPSEPESSEDEGQYKERDEELLSDAETENRGSSERSVRSDSDGEGGRRDRKRVHSRPPPPPPPSAAGKPGPPPPPPAPVPAPAPPRSALSSSVLGSLQSAARESLRKVAPPPEPKVDDRAHLLRSIQLGSSQLKGAPSKAAAPFQKIAVQQNEAVAAILANRSKIAGSDTESSDDSDSDYTDDDY